MVFLQRDDEEAEAPEDEDAPLADDVLDEVETAEVEDVALIEGFGIIAETPEESEEEEKDDEDAETTTALEEDAEDVDFDTFDDVDEM